MYVAVFTPFWCCCILSFVWSYLEIWQASIPGMLVTNFSLNFFFNWMFLNKIQKGTCLLGDFHGPGSIRDD